MNFRWVNIKAPADPEVQMLQAQLKIHPLLCQLLLQRGVNDFDACRQFFRPDLKKLHNPFLMKDMDKAVERIDRARQNSEKILVYGDYDVDGTTAVSLLSSFLLKYHSRVDTYIPDRYKEGYGVSTAGINYARDNEVSLIIALDCGIKALDKVKYAGELGIDFIICDHHRPGDQLPEAIAVLDPKRKDCPYPYKELSGCGVGFKLVQALCRHWGIAEEETTELLDLLAVSIGSDIVPINGENRILAQFGLQKINNNPRPGFARLVELAGKKDKKMDISDVVFLIGPRINAAGRISHGKLAVQLLTGETDNEELEAQSIEINEHNNHRKELDSSITEEALAQITALGEENRRSTVVYHESWHKGVIGIVASRLIEKYYRPTIVFTKSNEVLAGSARSVKGFDVYEALDSCSDLLEQFGGHMYAAGMTISPQNFSRFKQRFEEVVSATISDELLIPQLEVDAILKLKDIQPSFYRILSQFAPYGPANMNPVFRTDFLHDTGRSGIVGADKTHLKLDVFEKSSGLRISGIAFGMADKLPLVLSGKPISVAYHLEINEYNNQQSFQMMVKDIKLTDEILSR